MKGLYTMALLGLVLTLCHGSPAKFSNNTLQEGVGVYWCARDYELSPVGNYSFVLVVYPDIETAEYFKIRYGFNFAQSVPNNAGVSFFYTTFSANKQNGYLHLSVLDKNDVQAFKEVLDPEKYTSWYKADFDMQANKVDWWRLQTAEGEAVTYGMFVDSLLQKLRTFQNNYQNGLRLKYEIDDVNSFSFVNTLLKTVGIPDKNRSELRSFSGVNVGANDYIDDRVFLMVTKVTPNANLIQFV